MKIIMILLMMALCMKIAAQTDIPDMIEMNAEKLTETPENADDVTDALEDLNWIRDHPVNVNDATEDQLGQIPALNAKQVQSLLTYRKDYGKIFTPYELQGVEGFDSALIMRIMPYISFGDEPSQYPITFKNLLSRGRNDLFLRYQQMLEKQAGYTDKVSETQRYQGNPARYYLRYAYNYYNRVSLGLSGEKDPGEQFFGNDQSYGMDFYSGYFCFQDKGFLKKLIIGNFKAGFGQGLVLGSGSLMSSMPGMNGMRYPAGIRPTLGTDENNYLRGFAVAFGRRKITATLFYSGHRRDANVISVDSANGEVNGISALQETGYHRTISEIADKNSILERITGGNISYRNDFLRIGVTSFYSRWSVELPSSDEFYKKYSFSGKENLNTGIDFRLLFKDVYFFGELGRSMNGGIAYLAGFQTNPDPRLSISANFRNYEPQYQDLRGSAVGQNSSNSNERGFNVSVGLQLPKSLVLSGYADLYRFPFMKYGINTASSGNEFLVGLTYNGIKNLPMYFRIRETTGETGIKADKTDITVNTRKYSVRYQNDWLLSQEVTLRTRLEAVAASTADQPYHYGYLVCQALSYKTTSKFIAFHFSYGLFDTWSYSERIYLYENDVLYGYSVPALAGKGIRCSSLLEITPLKRINIWLRYAVTWYSDRMVISSGASEIDGNTSSELKIQLRVRF